MSPQPIYLDNNATTCLSEHVITAMLPFLRNCYFNASSSSAESTGACTPRARAAAALASLLNAESPDCFTFTSGATESNNWVFNVFNVFNALRGASQEVVSERRPRGRVVISAVEHPSVAKSAEALQAAGYDVVEAPVDNQGVIQIDALSGALGPSTVLVSIMAANNETGVLCPMDSVGLALRAKAPRALWHVDATQAVGKIPIDLCSPSWTDVDLVSFSAHKLHGPKGVGGLYIRPGVTLPPMMLGGSQEKGLRAGTTNTPGLAGLAAAIEDVDFSAMERIARLRNAFEAKLEASFRALVHSKYAPRLPTTSCFSIPNPFNGTELAKMLADQGVMVGTGAACSGKNPRPSKTVLAMGVPIEIAQKTLRVSLSRWTTPAELDAMLLALYNAIHRAR